MLRSALGSETAARIADDQALEDRIIELEGQVSALTEQIQDIRDNMGHLVLEALKTTLRGYDRQIAIVYQDVYGQPTDAENADKVVVKFAPNAEFVADMTRENTGDTQTIEYGTVDDEDGN